MKNYKIILQYDGSRYKGWQTQKNTDMTIQGKLEAVLERMAGHPVEIHGSGRTDAGVHALAQTADFKLEEHFDKEEIFTYLNEYLPEDIRVRESCEVAPDFHPRHCSSRKTYEYRILNRRFPIPTLRHDTYFYYRPLDVEAMKEAAGYLVGEHDFKSFCTVGAQVETTVRTIYDLTVTKEEDVIKIRVTGNGFLYNMVRILAGTLISVGIHEQEPEDMTRVLAACDRTAAGPTAPACGLTMVGISYETKKQ